MHTETHEPDELQTSNFAAELRTESSPTDFVEESFPHAARDIRTIEQLDAFMQSNFEQIRRTVIASCLHAPEQAEDVFQELYPRLVRFLADSTDGIHEAWKFIRTTSRRLAIDEFRRAAVRSTRFVPLYDETFLPHKQSDNPSDADETEKLTDLLHQAISSLPERQRFVITRIFLDEKTGRDVAQELGLSESYTAELKAEAVSKLRTYLRECLSAAQ